METLEIRHASAAQRHQLGRRGESNWNKANRGRSQNMELQRRIESRASFKILRCRWILSEDQSPFTFNWEIDNGSNKSLSRRAIQNINGIHIIYSSVKSSPYLAQLTKKSEQYKYALRGSQTHLDTNQAPSPALSAQVALKYRRVGMSINDFK